MFSYGPPQGLELEEKRKIKNKGGVIFAPRAKQGIVPIIVVTQ